MRYDYLIAGAGLFGCVFAHQMHKAGKKCLVIDKRSHIGGNVYCENIEGINVHRYGAHIFHTNDKEIWDFVNAHVPFNHYRHTVLADFSGDLYNLPFNMNTFYSLWGTKTPEAAKEVIEQQKISIPAPDNLVEQALSLVGRDIYEKLIKGYTEKHWGRKPADLPAFIIRRLPLRYTFDNSYFDDKYQGIPVGGYNKLIKSLLNGIEVRLEADYILSRSEFDVLADTIVYTGKIDELFGYRFGHLEYRSLDFKTELLDTGNFQGTAVVNYTQAEVPFTRIIEHKHFEFGKQKNTIITREYSKEYKPGDEPYYPVNDKKNQDNYLLYKKLADSQPNLILGGRLAEYRYYDMHQVIASALKKAGATRENDA